ncbi:carboxymuconolactone decarboxylase family protein [Actinosynnema sp. CS-041913]|uniref:carboxymuconolactone decarboxylase family protein n=1 Tax=Actinosynnema sp. CS-041913 TaxID=3239917 RepID=UPI003D8CFCE3
MAHIHLGVDETLFPGITGPMRFRPETAGPLNQLAETLLRGPHTLPPGERELIAAYVSALNRCVFCCDSHSAIAAAQLDDGMALVKEVLADIDAAPIPDKLRALLHIAAAVQKSGQHVTTLLVDEARSEGATDVEIHDTVLIAAAFCMFNRYVDGLGTLLPEYSAHYAESARHIVEHGYGGPVANKPAT